MIAPLLSGRGLTEWEAMVPEVAPPPPSVSKRLFVRPIKEGRRTRHVTRPPEHARLFPRAHLSQWLHLNGLAPVCFLKCLVSSSLRAKRHSQPSHEHL